MMIEAAVLTALAGLWRFLDGRGIPRMTALRNVIGLGIAGACATLAFGLTWPAIPVALVAWVSLIAGYTNWRSWWSIARYGAATVAIAVFLGSLYAGWQPVALYGVSGLAVGAIYTVLHRYIRDFGHNTAVCEVIAGAVIIGGVSWL